MEVFNKQTTATTKNQWLDGLKSRVETTKDKLDKLGNGSIEFNCPKQLRVNRLKKVNEASGFRETTTETAFKLKES